MGSYREPTIAGLCPGERLDHPCGWRGHPIGNGWRATRPR